jgi:hypothetical protein
MLKRADKGHHFAAITNTDGLVILNSAASRILPLNCNICSLLLSSVADLVSRVHEVCVRVGGLSNEQLHYVFHQSEKRRK